MTAPTLLTSNAESGISSAKTYTHLLDFGDGGGATVNGVAFTGAGVSGGNWSLTGANILFPEGAGAASSPTFPDEADGSGLNQLYRDFYYNGIPAQLTLNGLTPGVNYEARIYNRFFGGSRIQTMTFDDGNGSPTPYTFDQDGTTTPNYIAFKFTAASDTLSMTAAPQIPGNTLHWYAASVEAITLGATTLTVGDAGNYLYEGTLTGEINLVKQGTGIQTLAGANPYTGTTSVSAGTLRVTGSISGTSAIEVNNDATLQLGGSGNRLRDNAPLTLGREGKAGTLSMEGLSLQSETLGALTLSGPGNIDFGTGNSDTLLFSNLTLGTFTLKVFNWSGFGATQDHLVFGSDISGTNSLTQIQFYSDSGASFLGEGRAIGFGGGGQVEIVPVPEPSASLLSLMAIGLLGRRRLARKLARRN